MKNDRSLAKLSEIGADHWLLWPVVYMADW